jgi:tetratricopeptide (TPR) repeat protein
LKQPAKLTKPKKITCCLLILLIAGCSLQKESGFNRSMQNLTAHYNILFNANQILLQKQQDYATAFVDSYNEILPVYQDTAVTKNPNGLDKDLQLAVDKANKIINEKEQSHYLGDAYLVMGKANYLGANYFNAAEYFAYVIRSFAKQKKLMTEALVWNARTQLYLNHPDTAKILLDTAFQRINPKKINPADIYATKLQYDINMQDYKDGEEMAKQAIHYCRDSKQRLRWRFILAQLQELNGENNEAYANYGRIAGSNANFEMAFNAQLNQIRIADRSNGAKTSRIDQLRALLKNPNNKEFTDQVYYQIGQQYYGNKDYDNAIANYKLSVRNSVKNQNQKGLSYLRIADIEFSNKADYVRAKKYYDSTVLTLSPNYPGYLAIQKKTNNLQLLTDRLQIISREDTLQMLTRLDEKTRNKVIDSMVTREILQQQQQAQSNIANSAKSIGNSGPGSLSGPPGTSSFYFYNSNAVSQGYNDFKRIWGDRKLEDNWRRSNRSNTDQAANSVNPNVAATVSAMADPFAVSPAKVNAADYRQQIVQNLPLTTDKLALSNLRIFNAYLDIANFYRDVLDDKKDAIDTYNTILKRFPNNPNLPAIYYSLYRLYSETHDAKADAYKNKLLTNYPGTPFAQTILDPDYSKKMGDRDAEFNTLYNSIYDLYAHHKYTDVVSQVDAVQKQYPNNKYSAQLYYLRAISAGHSEPLVPFENDLQQIAANYPNDKLIVPLVKKHLDYINANLVDMSKRHYALSETDTTEVPFTPPRENQKQTPFHRPHHYAPEPAAPLVAKQVSKPVTVVKKDSVKATTQKTVITGKPVAMVPATVFSMRDSTNYYFVINITNNTTNLSSSRFGIGQFNRAHYDNSNITHQLTYIGDHTELIYIGRFYSLEAAKAYARTIIPLMSDIMKIPKEKYSFFIVTKQNLDKLADQKTLDSYLDYYQKNY